MKRNVKIGITPDYFKNGQFILPGPGLGLLDQLNNASYGVLPRPESPESQQMNQTVIQPFQIEGYDFAASIAPKWNGASFSGNPSFISVHRHGAGFDMVDVDALTASNVLLCTTPEAVTRPMAVVILTYLLLLSTRYSIKNKIAVENRWGELSKYPGFGLVGKTFGSIGAGRIARETFRLAKPLNMKHIAYDPYLAPGALASEDIALVDFETVLRESDYISIACPLNAQTRHLIDQKAFSLMKPGASFINAARGPIVDEQALVEALQSNKIRSAGIDVFEQEPPSPDNPLFHMDNVAVTPHALGWTDQAVMGIWAQIVDQMQCLMRGKKPNGIINDALWDKPEFQQKLGRFLDETR